MDPLRPLLARLGALFAHPRWPAVRALLILLHVTAVLAVACPAPLKGSTEKNWRRPGVRAELRAWSTRLRAVGVDADEADLARFGQRVSTSWSAARNVAVAPFSAWLRAVGATQGWYMFTAPDRAPQRFSFTLHTASPAAGADVAVFDFGRDNAGAAAGVVDDGGVDGAWYDPAFLAQHRVRRAFFQTAWSDRPVFREVCSWLVREAKARRPDVVGATCRLVEQGVLSPAMALDRAAPPAARVVRTLRVDATGEVRK